MSEPLDLKKLLEEFNEIPDNPIHTESSKNNSSNNIKSNPNQSKTQSGKYKPLIEAPSWSAQHLSPGVYQMKHPRDENDNSGNDNRQPRQPRNQTSSKPNWVPIRPQKNPTRETIPLTNTTPTEAPKPVEPQAEPESKLPDWNIEFDGKFTDAEKKGIFSTLGTTKWKPVFKKELLASKEDLLEGFRENPEFIVRTIDENQKVGFIPYKLFDRLFKRSKETTLNVNNSAVKFVVMLPKNDTDIIESSAYGDTDALVKINDRENLYIIKLNTDTYNFIFSKNKNQNIEQVEQALSKPTQTPKPVEKSVSKSGLTMVDEDDEVKEPIKSEPKKETPKPSYKMVDEDSVEKVKSKNLKISPEKKADIKSSKPASKPIGKPKLRMVDEMPTPQELVGKNLIVRTKETGNKDIKVRVNSYDPTTDKFNINYQGANWRGIPANFIQNGFVRMAAK